MGLCTSESFGDPKVQKDGTRFPSPLPFSPSQFPSAAIFSTSFSILLMTNVGPPTGNGGKDTTSIRVNPDINNNPDNGNDAIARSGSGQSVPLPMTD